jgi:hypothetical protein
MHLKSDIGSTSTVLNTAASTMNAELKLQASHILIRASTNPVSPAQVSKLTSVTNKFADRFKNRTVLPPSTQKTVDRPFYVDVSANVYTLLHDTDNNISEVAYNATIGNLTAGSEFHTSPFKANLSEADKAVDEHVAQFIYRVQTMNLRENYWLDNGQFGALSKALVSTTASEYYNKRIHFDPLIESNQLEIKRGVNESKREYILRRQEHTKRPIIRNDAILRGAIKSLLTHKDAQAHANALVHMLKTTCKRSDLGFMEAVIARTPKLIPTIPMLRRLGHIPDISIKEYQSLFHRTEWIAIQGSALYKAESQLKEILKTKITLDNLELVLADLRRLGEDIHKDILSVTSLSVKKKRLAKTAMWKRSMPRTVVQPLEQAKLRIFDEGVFNTFSPFDILAAANYERAGELITYVRYNKVDKAWFDDQDIIKLLVPNSAAALSEFLAWLNSN